MRSRIRLAGALLAVPAVLAGCGGGGSDSTAAAPVETTAAPAALTKAELIAQGDGICAEVNAAVGTVASSATEGASSVTQEADLYAGMVERLKDLGAPSDDTAGYSEFIAAAEELAQAESNAQLAAARGEEGGLATAESESSTALASFQSAAQAYGFEKCDEAPSAPVPSSSGSATEEPSEEASGGVEEEAVPPEEVEPAPEAGGGVEEEAGGGAAAGGGTGGGSESSGGGGSGGIGPG